MWTFFWHGITSENQVENGLEKLFDFWVQIIDVSDNDIFVLTCVGLNNRKVINTTIGNPIKESQRRTCHFLLLIIAVQIDQSEPKFKYRQMNCRDCVQLQSYENGIDARIYDKIFTPLPMIFWFD